MKVPITESETSFHRGRKQGMVFAIGSIMGIAYTESPELYALIKEQVLEWAEDQGIVIPLGEL